MFKHDFAQERKCPVCGKTFIMPDAEQWAYRVTDGRKKRSYCSWHCLREYERANGHTRNYTRRV